ncbi:hypothetical protein [Micromonospora sp. B9E7]|uniref:hypothetical protein n=1 Tax=Micromonospora sp. B9E7 TaxID=3153574 RepID=UPI00325D05DF
MKVPSQVVLPLVTLVALAACGTSSRSAGEQPSSAPPTPPTAAPSAAVRPPAAFDEALHDELIGMLERDQADRGGTPQTESDQARTTRLKEIIRTHGWPR